MQTKCKPFPCYIIGWWWFLPQKKTRLKGLCNKTLLLFKSEILCLFSSIFLLCNWAVSFCLFQNRFGISSQLVSTGFFSEASRPILDEVSMLTAIALFLWSASTEIIGVQSLQNGCMNRFKMALNSSDPWVSIQFSPQWPSINYKFTLPEATICAVKKTLHVV